MQLLSDIKRSAEIVGRPGRQAGGLTVIATIPLLIAIACAPLLFAASLAVTFVDKAAIRAHVTSGLTEPRSWYPHGNDCLVLYMVLAPHDSRWDAVISPKIPQDGGQLCPELLRLATTGESGAYWHYRRYLHGARTIVAPLVANFPVREAETLVLASSYALLGLAAAVLLWRRRADDAPLIGFGLVLLGSMSLFYITPYYGKSLTFVASDLSIYVLLIAVLAADWARRSIHCAVALASLLGVGVAYVEFLTGQAPLGLTLLIALTAASMPSNEGAATLLQRSFFVGYAFAAAIVFCFAAKLVVLSLVESDTGNFFQSLLVRTGGKIEASGDGSPIVLGIDITQHPMYSPAAIFYSIVELGYFAKDLCRNNVSAEILLLTAAFLGLTIGGWSRWNRLTDSLERARTTAFVVAALVTPVWYLVFLNHTIIHAGFMIRALVGAIAIGLWLGGSEAIHRLSSRERWIAYTDSRRRSQRS